MKVLERRVALDPYLSLSIFPFFPRDLIHLMTDVHIILWVRDATIRDKSAGLQFKEKISC